MHNASSETIDTNLDIKDTPVLRIGLTHHHDSLEFKSTGKFSILNHDGATILREVSTPTRWKIKIEQSHSARYSYSLLLGEFIDPAQAEDLNYSLIEKGLGATIRKLGDKFYYANKVVNDNSQYWVVIDDFSSEEEVKVFANQRLPGHPYRIIVEKIKEPGAVIEVYDSEFEKIGEAENILRILPESPANVSSIFDISGAEKNDKYRAFRGPLEFRCNDFGKFIIISEISLERYISGVIATSSESGFPVEALKVLAIVLRSRTIAGLQIRHASDPFDICAESHCAPYRGITPILPQMMTAVKDTMGQVLVVDNKVMDANFSLSCGGCTENSSTQGSEVIHFSESAVFDTLKSDHAQTYGDLQLEENARQWINSEPDTFCNVVNLAEFIHYRNQYRWEVTYSREELEEIISKKEEKSIGTLYNLVAHKRSSSGRVRELEIIASRRNMVIRGEDDIRSILAHKKLNSTCFYIDSEVDDDGASHTFTIRGAGSGHGIGVCQVGSAHMAQLGYNHRKILSHYYPNSKIKKIY